MNHLRALTLVFGLLVAFCSSSSAQDVAERQIAAGDTINIKVYDEPDLKLETVVPKNGVIRLELYGDITILGMTTSEAARAIEKAYKDGYLIKPSVTVTVVAVVKKRFTITGQVNRPGPFLMTEGDQVTLLQAIGYANGFTRLANKSKVTIKRNGRSIPVDAKKLEKGTIPEVYIQPGDVVEVKESW